jgi:hypothetical protein
VPRQVELYTYGICHAAVCAVELLYTYRYRGSAVAHCIVRLVFFLIYIRQDLYHCCWKVSIPNIYSTSVTTCFTSYIMKIISCSSACLAFLSLQCTVTLADWSLNKTEGWFDKTIGNTWNDTKDWFEKEVSKEVADGLGALSTPGVLAQIPMGYSR